MSVQDQGYASTTQHVEQSCDKEPIHLPGSIQPHGYLIGLDPDSLKLHAMSENIQAEFPETGFGLVPDWLPAKVLDACRNNCNANAKQFDVTTEWGSRGEIAFHCFKSSGLIICEFEFDPSGGVSLHDGLLSAKMDVLVSSVRLANDIPTLSKVVAEGIRELSGFDRVLVYSFDPEGNGEVIAEAKSLDWSQSLLGLRFPGNDIPSQARALYLKAGARWTPTRDCRQLRLLSISGTPIDLTFSRYRSLSPVHLLYQRNIGADGALSVSVLRQDELWGLVIGHHRVPHNVPARLRHAVVALVTAFSLKLDAVLNREASIVAGRNLHAYASMLSKLAAAEDYLIAFTEGSPRILDIVPGCSGTALVWEDRGESRSKIVGDTPPHEALVGLVAWLHSNSSDAVLASDRITELYPPFSAYTAMASGVLAIQFQDDRSPVLLLFRPEEVKSVAWAGKPEKMNGASHPYLPRVSFDRWTETNRGHSARWQTWEIEFARTVCGTTNDVILRQTRRIRDLALSEEQFRSTIEQVAVGIVHLSLDGVILDTNDTFLEIVGYSREELVGRPAQTVVEASDLTTLSRICNEIALGNIPSAKQELRYLRKDGKRIWVRLTAAPKRDSSGRLASLIVVVENINDYKATALALEESELLLRESQEAAGIGCYVVDIQSGTWRGSQELAQILGIASASMQSLDDGLALIHVDDRALMMDFIGDGEDRQAERLERSFRVTRKDTGAERWVECLGQLEFDDQGRKTRLYGTIQDITERRKKEQELLIAATAFEGSQEGMMVTDLDTVILRVNDAFTRITGYTAEQAIGQRANLLNSGRQEKTFFDQMWESLRNHGAWQGEIEDRRADGIIIPEWLTINAVADSAGRPTHYVAMLADISARKKAEAEIQQLAFFDPLTSLPNRRLLADRLTLALASSARSGNEGALMFIDLDNFKSLNDTHGHLEGDLLLQEVARRLVSIVRRDDTVARLGGDEFVVMLENLDQDPTIAATQSEVLASKVLSTLNQPYSLTNHQHHSTASIGVTLFQDHRLSVDEILKRADIAMYQAKAEGRNTIRFFDPKLQEAVSARLATVNDLLRAINDDQLILYYQLQVGHDGHPVGAEALIRWKHPKRGFVSPAEFIPLAEESNLILALGHWVLEMVCRQLMAWAKSAKTTDLTIAVNVSARQFRDEGFVNDVLSVLRETGADPSKLKLELTESMLVHNVDEIIGKMRALNEIGVTFSLDDFGTGYSSLTYLKRLPLAQVKIDQSFVRDVPHDPNNSVIASTIIALGKSLGLTVIAEGVETDEQRSFLAKNGCQAYQGYLFGRPTPATEFSETLKIFSVTTHEPE